MPWWYQLAIILNAAHFSMHQSRLCKIPHQHGWQIGDQDMLNLHISFDSSYIEYIIQCVAHNCFSTFINRNSHLILSALSPSQYEQKRRCLFRISEQPLSHFSKAIPCLGKEYMIKIFNVNVVIISALNNSPVNVFKER